MRLINNKRVVLFQETVALRLGQQDAVGHQLDQRFRICAVAKADFVTDDLARRSLKFLGNPGRNTARRNSARLRMPDHPVNAAPKAQAYFRKLRRLPRSRLAAQNDDLVFTDSLLDFFTPLDDRKISRKPRQRPGKLPALATFNRRGQIISDLINELARRPALPKQLICPPQAIAQHTPVPQHGGWNLLGKFSK